MMPALLTLWFVLMVRTQTQAPGIPVEQEPKHRVVLKNDFVRVIDATLPPGYVIYERGCQEKHLPVGRQPGHNDVVGTASPAWVMRTDVPAVDELQCINDVVRN